MISGGFDPIHTGHIRMIQTAAKHGRVIAVLNSDEWLVRKKGFYFMSWKERAEIVLSIKGVVAVEKVNDADNTVCEALERLKPDYFANGGDRGMNNTPEQDVCKKLGIQLMWGVGGAYKANSSSDLISRILLVHPETKSFFDNKLVRKSER